MLVLLEQHKASCCDPEVHWKAGVFNASIREKLRASPDASTERRMVLPSRAMSDDECVEFQKGHGVETQRNFELFVTLLICNRVVTSWSALNIFSTCSILVKSEIL